MSCPPNPLLHSFISFNIIDDGGALSGAGLMNFFMVFWDTYETEKTPPWIIKLDFYKLSH